MKAKLIGGVMMGMLLCVGAGNVAKAQGCGRGGVSFSLNVGTPMGGGYVSSGPAYCPPPPVAYCPPPPVAYYPQPVVYRQVYRRPYCGPRYYNGPACGAPVVYNNYYNGGHGHGYNNGRHNGWGPRGHR